MVISSAVAASGIVKMGATMLMVSWDSSADARPSVWSPTSTRLRPVWQAASTTWCGVLVSRSISWTVNGPFRQAQGREQRVVRTERPVRGHMGHQRTIHARLKCVRPGFVSGEHGGAGVEHRHRGGFVGRAGEPWSGHDQDAVACRRRTMPGAVPQRGGRGHGDGPANAAGQY